MATRKAFEIITLIRYKGVDNIFLRRYIVISTSNTKAFTMLKLEKDEEFLESKQLTHIVVTE